MKDIPHHIKKLNRQVVRSSRREMMEDENYDFSTPPPPNRKPPKEQMRKQTKAKLRKEKLSRTPTPLTAEEKNKKMKKRVPVFAWDNHPKQKTTPSKKKTPRM